MTRHRLTLSYNRYGHTRRYDGAFSRPVRPELCGYLALCIERAQGRSGACRPHGPPAEKMQAAEPQVRLRTSRPSLRNGWNGLYVLSPGNGCLAPVIMMRVIRTAI